MWSGLIKGVTDLGGKWIERKGKWQEAQLNYKIKVLDRELEDRGKVHDKDLQAIKNNNKTIMDEILTITLLLPLWVTLYSALGGDPSIATNMWDALHKIPYFYQIVLGSVIVYYYGYRSLVREYLSGKFGGLRKCSKTEKNEQIQLPSVQKTQNVSSKESKNENS